MRPRFISRNLPTGTKLIPDFSTVAAAAGQLAVKLTEVHYRRLCHYAELLGEWNKKVNLISRKDTERIFSYHIIDSIAVSNLIPEDARCGDIGTGAGLPGIPLAIVRQDLDMILIESVKKKCRFLEFALPELGLKNARVLCERAEALAPLQCDILLSRLTAPLSKTLKYCARHIKPGGSIILYKSPNAPEKISEGLLQKLAVVLARTIDIVLPLSGIPRRFLVFKQAPSVRT
ncbi:MAG: 16S rRNA (guanine(527)-N(7))-methyltransferase RsmG [bacterium]